MNRFAHRRLVLIRHGVLDRLEAQRITIGQTFGSWGRRCGRAHGHVTAATSFHVAVVAFFRYIGWFDHAVAVDLKQVNDATDEIDTCAKVANARPLVGTANDYFREFDLAWLSVEIEWSDAHVALELNEAVTVRVATNVETVEIAVVDLSAVHIQLLGVGRVEEDHVDVAITDVSADEQGRMTFVVVVSTRQKKRKKNY